MINNKTLDEFFRVVQKIKDFGLGAEDYPDHVYNSEYLNVVILNMEKYIDHLISLKSIAVPFKRTGLCFGKLFLRKHEWTEDNYKAFVYRCRFCGKDRN